MSVESVLRQLSFTVQGVRLYPRGSPVVRAALDRTHASLQPLLTGAALDVAVLPTALRVGSETVGGETPIVRQLAARLHAHGIARVQFDAKLDLQSLQRFCELIARDREGLDVKGGIEWVLDRDTLSGVTVERLQLERLFDDPADTPDEDPVWDALVRRYRPDDDSAEMEWTQLSSDPAQLKQLVDWVLRHAAELDTLMPGHTQTEVVSSLCGRLDTLTPAVRAEVLSYLVLAVREAFDQIDPDTLLQVLSESSPPAPGAVEARGAADPEAPEETSAGAPIAALFAQGLDGSQIERLIVHTLQSRRSSPRLYGLLSQLVEGRADRGQIVRQVGAAVEDAATGGEGEGTFVDRWPKFQDVLSGEAPDRFLGAEYSATLRTLTTTGGSAAAWPVDRIRKRLDEMDPYRILVRKCRVLLQALDHVSVGDDYRTVASELERALPELLRQGDHAVAEQIVALLSRHRDADSARSEAQRETAAAILGRFYQDHNLRQHVRDALTTSHQETDSLVRLLRLGGAAAAPVLVTLLSDETSRPIRQRVLRLLAAMGESTVEELTRHLDDERWYVLRNLVLILGEVGDDTRAPDLEAAIHHPDSRVRYETVGALLKISGPVARSLLAVALEDEDEAVQLAALHALGHLNAQEVVPQILAFLRLPNWRGQRTRTVQTAAIAVGRLRATEAEPVLTRVARRPWFFATARQPAHAAATWALRAVRGQAAGPAPDLSTLTRLRPGQKQFVSATE